MYRKLRKETKIEMALGMATISNNLRQLLVAVLCRLLITLYRLSLITSGNLIYIEYANG